MNCNCVDEVTKELTNYMKPQAGEDAKVECLATGFQLTKDMGLRMVINIPFKIKGSKKGFTSVRGKEMPCVASFCPFCGVSTKPAPVPA